MAPHEKLHFWRVQKLMENVVQTPISTLTTINIPTCMLMEINSHWPCWVMQQMPTAALMQHLLPITQAVRYVILPNINKEPLVPRLGQLFVQQSHLSHTMTLARTFDLISVWCTILVREIQPSFLTRTTSTEWTQSPLSSPLWCHAHTKLHTMLQHKSSTSAWTVPDSMVTRRPSHSTQLLLTLLGLLKRWQTR